MKSSPLSKEKSSEKLSLEAYTQLGSEALVQGKNKEAIGYFKLATKHYKDNATAWKQLGMAELAISTRTFCGSHTDKKKEEKEQNLYQKKAGKHLSKAKRLCTKGSSEYNMILRLQMHNCAVPSSFQKMENVWIHRTPNIPFTKTSKYNKYHNKLQEKGESYIPLVTKSTISRHFKEHQKQKIKIEQSHDNYHNTSNTVLCSKPGEPKQKQIKERYSQQEPYVLDLFNPQPNVLPQPPIQENSQPNQMRELYNRRDSGDGILPFNPEAQSQERSQFIAEQPDFLLNPDEQRDQVVDPQLEVLQEMLNPKTNLLWQQRVSEKQHYQQGNGQSRN